MPKDADGWKEALDKAFLALKSVSDRLSPRAKDITHRRGTFPTLPHGLSFGGGQTVGLITMPAVFRANGVVGASIS